MHMYSSSSIRSDSSVDLQHRSKRIITITKEDKDGTGNANLDTGEERYEGGHSRSEVEIGNKRRCDENSCKSPTKFSGNIGSKLTNETKIVLSKDIAPEQSKKGATITHNHQQNIQYGSCNKVDGVDCLEKKTSSPNQISNKVRNLKESVKTKAQYNVLKSGLDSKASGIYGVAGSGCGSWSFYNRGNIMDTSACLSSMTRKEETVTVSNLEHEGMKKSTDKNASKGGGIRGVPANVPNWWRFQVGTLLEVRTSHLLKLVCLLMVMVALVAITFHSRIRSLEVQRNELREELAVMKMHYEKLADRMEAVVELAIPPKSARSFQSYSTTVESTEQSDEDYNELEGGGAEMGKKRLVKRSAERTTKKLQYPSASLNELNNGSTSYETLLNGWTTGVTPKQMDTSKSSTKGNEFAKNLPFRKHFRQLRKELKEMKAAHLADISNLKRKISKTQQRLRLASLSCCNDSTSSNISSIVPGSANGPTRIRAAYLQLEGKSVNIKKQKLELIGPWYLPNSGNDIEFNDMWYDNLALDSNGTSVVFQEDGLFLIYAQVFYQLQHNHNSKPSPMGFRIYLKKSGKRNADNSYRRPDPIAECVPSFPSTFYQTCFTQVAWFVEAHDEVYLEHFMDSLPIIEASSTGQTFFGIVRLSN